MKQLLLLLFCFTTIVFANIDNNDTNKSIGNAEVKTKTQSIFLSYEETPSTVYVGELFTIKIKAIIANDDFEEIKSTFQNSKNLDILNPDARWKWFSDNIFYNTYYMKVKDTNATLPSLTLDIFLDDIKIDSENLKSIKPNIIKLKGTKYFSGVIAKSLKIKKNKTTQFDDENLIVVLEIEAKQANLSDFKLSWVIRDGIDSSRSNLPYFNIFYYAIIPNHTKEFVFTYFNRETNKFDKISLPIVITDEQISTQVDLNPAKNSLQIYKDGAYFVVALIFLLLFIRRRKIVYIILIALLVALFVYDKNLFNSIKIEKGSQIKILPTKKSTVFYVTNRTLYAQKLDEREDYIKIILPNGKIGWLKNGKN